MRISWLALCVGVAAVFLGPVLSAASGADDALDAADGAVLLGIARAAASGRPYEGRMSRRVGAQDDRTMILTFYRSVADRNEPGYYWACSHAAKGETPAGTAEECGRRLRGWLAKLPAGQEELQRGVLAIDVVTDERELAVKHRILVLKEIEIGLDGLACEVKGGVFYLTPTDVLGFAKEGDILEAAWLERRSTDAPLKPKMRKIRTRGFVEKAPGGGAEEVMWGNVIRPRPGPDAMLRGCYEGALWLLRTQQENGSFLPAYNPATEDAAPEASYSLEDHMRATLVIAELNCLTPDERFERARNRALRYAGGFLAEERRLQMLYLRSKQRVARGLSRRRPGKMEVREEFRDEVTATALLLTTLCTAELKTERPTAGRMMKHLGEYLSALPDRKGRLYTSLASARVDGPQRIVKGEPYAEVLLALCMLQQVSPRERVGEKIGRMLRLMTSFRANSPPIGPRTIEALTEAYKLKKDRRLGEVIVQLGKALAGTQLQEKELQCPLFRGGFKDPRVTPQTSTVAQAVSGLAAAYEAARLLRLAPDAYRKATHDGAWFLLNMQYWKGNVFYLRHHRLILGAFRKGAGDLTLEVGETAEAMRALLGAATMIAELVPPSEGKKATGAR